MCVCSMIIVNQCQCCVISLFYTNIKHLHIIAKQYVCRFVDYVLPRSFTRKVRVTYSNGLMRLYLVGTSRSGPGAPFQCQV